MVTAAVTVTTNGTIAAASRPVGANDRPALLVAGVLGIPLFGLIGVVRRRKGKSAFFTLLAFAALAVAALQTMGCGGSFHSTPTPISGGTTPPGAYFLLVQGTGSDGNTYTSVLQLDVEL